MATTDDTAGGIALVTGGAGGIGAAVCRRLAAAGRRVAVADLDRAAIDAARRWRFNPEVRDGVPVAGRVRVPVDFVL